MTIEILEALPGRDYDRRRGYSAWLFMRFPYSKNPYRHHPQRAEAARRAFIEQHGYEPYLIQRIGYSTWWRAGPVEEEAK